MQWLIDNWDGVVAVIGGIVTVASAVTALTPTPHDDRIWSKVYKIIEALGLVIGKAKDP